MTLLRYPDAARATRTAIFSATALALWTMCAGAAQGQLPAPQAQVPSQIVGRIEGDDFVIEPDPASPGIETAAATDHLLSGARVTVRSGQARVIFEDGSGIGVCGAARFQLLGSPQALTVVLEYGQLDLHLDSAQTVSVFTPLIVATPISVGGGARQMLIGLGKNGALCLRAAHGAARLEQQLSGQSLLVPQFGEISLEGGQVAALKSPAGSCACSVDEARFARPPGPTTQQTLSALGTGSSKAGPAVAPGTPPTTTQQPSMVAQVPVRLPPPAAVIQSPPASPWPPTASGGGPVNSPQAPAATPQPPSEISTPIYKVLVPPLTFDASSPSSAALPNAQTILLVRSVRVQPDTVYHGHVQGSAQRVVPTKYSPLDPDSQRPSRGFFSSVGRFFRRIFS
jgi:hypothetical protein